MAADPPVRGGVEGDVLGLGPQLRGAGLSYEGLLIFCALFGVGGSFVSLQLSRWMAKRAMRVVLIDALRRMA